MINWMYYPKTRRYDPLSQQIVQTFQNVQSSIDSDTHSLHSNDVLAELRTGLESIGFSVEKSKRAEDKIHVPVLFGINGQTQLAFDADAYHEEAKYVIEVEAGRAVVNYQFLKDFFEACAMYDAEYLCIAVRNIYRNNKDFETLCSFFDVLYSTNRLVLPLKGLLIIGY
ncbi:MAG: hypothetical protein IJB85_08575 [Clostridia bacterium]|nr:hypothetical protein [Clostridia bacterium]